MPLGRTKAWPKALKAFTKGQSPLQELEGSPHSELNRLVVIYLFISIQWSITSSMEDSTISSMEESLQSSSSISSLESRAGAGAAPGLILEAGLTMVSVSWKILCVLLLCCFTVASFLKHFFQTSQTTWLCCWSPCFMINTYISWTNKETEGN